MRQKLLKRTEGFTIIEVLIVLAIAGLILLIVFLAVPALQRNSRNTSIKNDVAGVLGGISEYQGVNSGAMPTGVAGTGTINYTGGNATTSKVQGSTTVVLSAANPTNTGTIDINIGTTCGGVASARAVAARYLLETTSGTVPQCQDS